MLRVIAVKRNRSAGDQGGAASRGTLFMAHDERHLRRRVLRLADGTKILFDQPASIVLACGDQLLLDDDTCVAIRALDEALYSVTPRDTLHLVELAWHIGNRHLAAAIQAERILILRDHVIKAMLEGLGATVADIMAPFHPVQGAYSERGGGESGDGHGHTRRHAHSHAHGHSPDDASTAHGHDAHGHDHA
ncbi:urease accessory protein UreE [Pandoraea oxalativorans]|uniref:urease accessory protein UreE n=1 Tax=Pandoraea oxalativorans TaxID=573737 RepID=UPI0009FC882D|nr:hypothetical protein [Pandoraea oxalativorans]